MEQIEAQLATVREHAHEAGRDPEEVAVVPRARPDGDPSEWVEHAREWRALGASHLAVDTIGMELSVEEHIEKTVAFYEAMAEAGLVEQ